MRALDMFWEKKLKTPFHVNHLLTLQVCEPKRKPCLKKAPAQDM